MSISSPLNLYHFQAFLIWWHSPFKDLSQDKRTAELAENLRSHPIGRPMLWYRLWLNPSRLNAFKIILYMILFVNFNSYCFAYCLQYLDVLSVYVVF
jgi:hypothetical protein